MLTMKTIVGAGWMILARFLGRFIDFFTLLILARILTPADFGLIALAMTLIVIVDTVLEIPVTQALVRLKEIDKSHLDTAFTLNMMRSAAIALLVWSAAWPFASLYQDARLAPLMLVLSLSPILRGFYSPAMIHFNRSLNFRPIFASEMAAKIIAFGTSVAIVMKGGGYWGLAASPLAATLVVSLISQILAPYRPRFSLARLDHFSGFIGWFSLSQLVSAINWQFDRAMLGRVADRETLGRYTVASDFAVLPTQSIIGPAMQPVMSAFSAINDIARLQGAFLKATRYAMIISMPIAIGVALTADLAIALLLGEKWQQADMLLAILSLAVMPVPYLQTLVSLAVARNTPQVAFRLNAIDFALRLVLLPAGYYFGHVTGVAAARCALSFMMFPVYMRYARTLSHVGLRAQALNLLPACICAAAMATTVATLRALLAGEALAPIAELTMVASVGAATYLAGLYLCGVRIALSQGRPSLSEKPPRWLASISGGPPRPS